VLIQGGAHARWVPTGHLVYIRLGTLMAVPFDLEDLQVTGSEVPVMSRMLQSAGVGLGDYAYSRDGLLVCLRGGAGQDSRRFAWVDQTGRVTPLDFPLGAYGSFDLSPDEKHVVYDKTKDGVDDVWLMELGTGVSTQLTFEGGNFGGVWHPSGDRIAFNTYRHGPYSVYEMPVDRSGPEKPLLVRDVDAIANAYTPDGEQLVVWLFTEDGFGDLYALSLSDTSRLEPIATEPLAQYAAAVHPDGGWVAYQSFESGRNEVYVRALHGSGRVVQVSVNGGSTPKWSADGGTLYYWQGDNLLAARVQTERQLGVGARRELFTLPDVIAYDVASDGRFLIIQGDPTSKPELTVVTNWFEELTRLTEGDE
jgi:serine/threonine-protein kinase